MNGISERGSDENTEHNTVIDSRPLKLAKSIIQTHIWLQGIKGKRKKKESIIAKLPLVAVQHSMENCDWSLVIPLYIKAPKSYLVCHVSLCCVLCVRKNSRCIKSVCHSHVVLHKGQQDVLLHWLFLYIFWEANDGVVFAGRSQKMYSTALCQRLGKAAVYL